MGLQIRESLRSLCCSNGWSYGVVWRAKCHDSMLLISGDAYHEEHIAMLANKMLHQVHVVGEGIIGQVASTGKHRWIFSDTYFGVSSPEGLVDNQAAFQDTAEWYHQFMAGIKTIAVISVSPQTVVQFGSTQKIPEKLGFVDHVKSLFQQLQSVLGPSLSGNAWKPVNRQTNDLNGTFASLLLSSNSYFSHANIKPLHDSICKEMMAKARSSSNHAQSLDHLTSRLHHGCLQPHALAVPEISSSICATNDSNGLHQKTATFMNNSSFHLKNGFQTEGAEAQVIFSSPNMQLPQVLQSNSSSANSSLLNNTSMSTWGNEASALTSTTQRLPPATGIGSRNTFLTNLRANVSCGNTFPKFHRNPSSPPLYSTNGSVDGITDTMVNKRYGMQELVDSQHHSPLFHAAEGKQSTSKSYSSVTPLVPQLPREPASIQAFLGNFRPTNPTSAPSKPNTVSNLNQWTVPVLEPVKNGLPTPLRGGPLQAVGGAPISSGFIEGDVLRGIPISDVLRPVQNPTACDINSLGAVSDGKENSLSGPMQLDNDLFDCLGLDLKQNQGLECWEDFMLPEQCGNHSDLMTGVSECISELDARSMNGSAKGLFSDLGLEQLLDAVVGNAGSITNNSDDRSSTTTITRAGSMSVYSNQVPLAGLSCLSESMGLLPKNNSEKTTHGCQKEAPSTSLISSWIDSSYNINAESAVVSQPKRVDEPPKVTRKRARPGESTRPRPKDRQQIQDRVKELREIVPNGAKCSIDSLLDRTIKHMLFLQSVTKYAKKLKEVDEPKMIGKESGVVLKDNSSGSGGGATWAFEVGGQTMVCPIVVEDLNPPGQMLVEMLCEERGFFLEIADIIRGFGLTILKGVMEVRDSKIWARFVVEANREITRMDIFLSLVQLLQETTMGGISSGGQPTAAPDGGVPVFSNYQKSPMPLPISLADRMQ
ncbi:transcription factor LHW-like isoform X2 [Magnolia sinica]|uniref:transcription factor LHW-like isoform X2 n=1 Tax=Magnolia sinica TaxID=86752 RepID=UPI0026590980|nr:transcription factor LHW-like isoform X2 [Magnolia sinica]